MVIFTAPSWVPKLPQDMAIGGVLGDWILKGRPQEAAHLSENEAKLIDADTREVLDRQRFNTEVETLAAGLLAEIERTPYANNAEDLVVAILCENSIRYLVYCFAIHRIGGTCLLLHTTNTAAENADQLRAARCSIIITSPAQAKACDETVAKLADPNTLVWSTTRLPLTDANQGHVTCLNDILEAGSSLEPIPKSELSNSDAMKKVAFLCATSGTSGEKKLARVTHASLRSMLLQVELLVHGLRWHAETTPTVLPMSHIYGLGVVCGSIYAGDTVIVHHKIDIKVFHSISTYKAQSFHVVPAMIAAIVDTPFLFKMFDLSSLETIGVGAGAVSATSLEKMRQINPTCKVITGYGLTESGGVVSMTMPDDVFPGSTGILLPGVEARLLRPDGTEVEQYGEPGELYVRSPSIVAGYLGDEPSNGTTFKDGWLRTGDVVSICLSPNGNEHLVIVDRLRDMIKVKGLHIAPFEIEDCLRLHEGVKDVAVIGVPDELAGERVQAFIVPRKRLRNDRARTELARALDAHVEARMTETHWLKERIVFVEELPRNATGKVMKRMLRDGVLTQIAVR